MDIAADDYRKGDARFQRENFEANTRAISALRQVATKKNATPGQVALAWLLHKGDDIVPIPGTKRRSYIEENVRAATLGLSPAEIDQLDKTFLQGAAAGARYSDQQLALIER